MQVARAGLGLIVTGDTNARTGATNTGIKIIKRIGLWLRNENNYKALAGGRPTSSTGD